MRYVEMVLSQIKAGAADRWPVVVPLGCTEQQGPHLPVGFDTWFADELTNAGSDAAADRFGVKSLVMPVVPFGPTPEHRGFGAGYVDLPVPLHEALVTAILTSLVEQGFGTIMVWRGCGGHDLKEAIRDFNARWKGQTHVVLPSHPFNAIWCEVADPGIPGGHADSFTTSITLHRHPEFVRTAVVPEPSHSPVEWDDPSLDFSRYSHSGVIGDAGHASAELGAKLWEACVSWMAETIRTLREVPESIGIRSTNSQIPR